MIFGFNMSWPRTEKKLVAGHDQQTQHTAMMREFIVQLPLARIVGCGATDTEALEKLTIIDVAALSSKDSAVLLLEDSNYYDVGLNLHATSVGMRNIKMFIPTIITRLKPSFFKTTLAIPIDILQKNVSILTGDNRCLASSKNRKSLPVDLDPYTVFADMTFFEALCVWAEEIRALMEGPSAPR